MANAKVVRTYEYQGIELGKLLEFGAGHSRVFRTDLSIYDAIDLVRKMSPGERVHMKYDAYGVYRLLEAHELNPDDYVDNEDIMIHVANRGYRTLTELNHGDRRAWKLVRQRGLENELFQDFQPKQK